MNETHEQPKCSHCGSLIADDAKFCEQCGTACIPATSPETGYWVIISDKAQGPHSERTLREWLAEGTIAADTLVWQQGMVGWAPLVTLFPNVTLTSQRPPSPSPSAHTSQGYGSRGAPSLSSGAARAALPAPPALHWSLVLLFTVLTFGVFALVWAFIQANWARKIDSQSNATLLLSIGVACGALGFFIGTVAGIALGSILILISWILQWVAYFSMASSMRRQLAGPELPLEIGGATLFFFTVFYLQGQLSWLAHWKDTGQTTPKAAKGIFYGIFWGVPAGAGVMLSIVIPAYQNYLVRAQVSEGQSLVSAVKTGVDEYVSNYGTYPSTNQSAGVASPQSISGRYVSQVTVGTGGLITVTYAGPKVNTAISGDVLVFSPTNNSGSVSWSCGPTAGTTIPLAYLPTSCRQ